MADLAPLNVLETAAGTGIVTSELAKYLSSGATIIATDLNPAMLEIAACFPDDPPQFIRRSPYSYNDVAVIRAALGQAGFGSIGVEYVTKRSRASNPRDPAVGFCQGSPMRSEIEARDSARLETVTEAVAEALAHRFGRGPIEGGIQAIVFDATR